MKVLVAFTTTLLLCACAASVSTQPRAAQDLPACRKARMQCDEARMGGSAGMREFCFRSVRECREAQAAYADSTKATATKE